MSKINASSGEPFLGKIGLAYTQAHIENMSKKTSCDVSLLHNVYELKLIHKKKMKE